MRVYLAGPMSGYPNHNFDAFAEAAARWRSAGVEVSSPAEMDGDEPDHAALAEVPWEWFIRRDLRVLLDCDAVAVLPGWQKSRGASLEVTVARALGMAVYDASAPDPRYARPYRESVLMEAERLVHGGRGEAYGHPSDDFGRTGRMWGAILGIPDVPAAKVGLCMAAVKISRECNRPSRDNRVDLAGYAETVEMIAEPGGLPGWTVALALKAEKARP